MMSVILVTWTAASAAIGSLVTGYALATVQRRRSIKDAGIAEVAAQTRLARFEVVRKLNGEARNLSHCLSYLTDDDPRFDHYRTSGGDSIHFYIERARKLAAEIREVARSESYVLGEPCVSAVHEATDIANLIIDIRVRGREKSLLSKRAEYVVKWRGRILSDGDDSFEHIGLYRVFERALYESFTLAAAPDSPSSRTRHNVRTTWTLRREGAIERSKNPEVQEEPQEHNNEQPGPQQEDTQKPSDTQQDLRLRLEAKIRKPEP